MFGWKVAIAVAASATILIALLITIIFRRYLRISKQPPTIREPTTPTQNRGKTEELPQIQNRATPNHPVYRRGSSTDSVDNGWSRFAFTNQGDAQSQVEITWEAGEKPVERIQKIRMNPGLKKSSSSSSSMAAKSVVKTAPPLPVFPQEAYFEITVLTSYCSGEDQSLVEGEKIQLIRKFDRMRSSDSAINLGSKSVNHALEERKLGSRGGDRGGLMMSVGLSCSSLVPLKSPGSYRASIGFNSDGSVYVDGIKLVFGSGKEEWGDNKKKVIGCGFNPLHKKVFFTVDSKLAHVVNCKSEGFSNPVYPVIAANADLTFLVNMGQTVFSYEPANAARTPNPCFVGPYIGSPNVYEDSGELFSMGRIDSGWLNYSATKNSTNSDVYSRYSGAYNSRKYNGKCKIKGDEEEDESEADLFEIVLDVSGKSPKV